MCSILYVHSVYVFYMSTVGCVRILYVHSGVCSYFICPQWGVFVFYLLHSGVCSYFVLSNRIMSAYICTYVRMYVRMYVCISVSIE